MNHIGLKSLNFLVLLALVAAQGSNGPAQPCVPALCQLPDCRCSSTDVPGGLDPKNVPQIILLTFNEGINWWTDTTLEKIFNDRFNSSNGCPIRATHFVSHASTDYTKINRWWGKGHEMGSISITHKNNITYWAQINSTGWHLEMDGMRTMLNAFGKIPLDEIKGVRSPDLQNGGDLQFVMMDNDNFLYDSSMPSRAFGSTNLGNGLWPYTFDYESIQDCDIEPCVYSSFPGIWEAPILDLEDDKGVPCSNLGGCLPGFDDANPALVLEFFLRNFNRAYNGNRPPFGLHMQVATLQHPHMLDGLILFFEYLSTLPDVYFVTVQEALEYVRHPVPLSEIDNFGPFKCDHLPRPSSCTYSENCRYPDGDLLPPELQGGGERYMNICKDSATDECPKKFPWLGNPLGEL